MPLSMPTPQSSGQCTWTDCARYSRNLNPALTHSISSSYCSIFITQITSLLRFAPTILCILTQVLSQIIKTLNIDLLHSMRRGALETHPTRGRKLIIRSLRILFRRINQIKRREQTGKKCFLKEQTKWDHQRRRLKTRGGSA